MIGVLCLHGFTGSPYEVEPLAQFLEEHTDWLVRVPTLPGHGLKLNLRGVSYHDWLGCAEKELQKLLKVCDEVYICGFSMGGLIGSWLSLKYPVKRLVLLSASAFFFNPKLYLKDVMEILKSVYQRKLHENELYQNYRRKFLTTPPLAYYQFHRLVQKIRPLLSEVSVPTLIIQGKRDPIVPVKSAQYIFNTIRAEEKQLLFVENAKHLICYADCQMQLFTEILAFLNESRSRNKKLEYILEDKAHENLI